ncbi:tRNA (32-2'-O)-methyltransferase regulator THADA-like isoform X2 [Elgaria multicarinata webbii]|uniref:tRNA (32-2'-O)-methyltransferase regulator THADA-like isoform X2 n=1 Tax=Elgaria multicarinata webbii TaxID=159646 RepID=UPI002FCD27F4
MSGSNYQRRKSALLLLAAILETCTDTWSPERKKGQPPRNMVALLNWARRNGSWDFFSASNTLALLSCLQDSTNEIRELASDLLICYFPPVFPESIAVALFERALEAMSSPRVQEVEAGAVLMRTILQKSDICILRRLLPEAKEEPDLLCQYLCFLRHLLGVLHVHLARASHDLLQAARNTPIHGVLSALRRCLLEVPEVMASMLNPQHNQHWQIFLSRLVNATRDVSSLLLGVLQGKQASIFDQEDFVSAAAPSFADMGNAIGGLIRLGKDLGPQEDDDSVLLSEEHSLILTCCWVSVKEIGLLLGGLAEKILPLSPPAGCAPLLPLQVVNTAAVIFQDILLKCRHWGAVEGCSVGFTKFCTALLSHPDPELQEIPRSMLTQGLALLNSPRSSSVTRRAAGFPMLFLCIVAGEDPVKPRPLLENCIRTSLALANAALPQDWDQTVDLPQVSAIHVLQTLVRGSGLGTALHQHVPSMVTLFLKALSSPSWAMRNAAIQLFGTLTIRLLGQNQSWDDGHGQDGVSPEAVFSRYPQLRNILLGELTSAVEVSVSRGKLHLCPSLYAILTFLAKLLPSADTLNSDSICFLEPLIQLSRNPIYAVRVMAARALVPLVPVTEYRNVLLRLAGELPQPDETLSHNALHGCLLQIQALLARALSVNCLSPDTLVSIACQVESYLWLISTTQRCPLIRTAYLQVVSLLVGSCSPSFVQQVREIVSSELANSKPVEKAGLSHIQVGSAIFCQHAVGFLCHEATRPGSPEGVRPLCLLLQSGNVDVQGAVLSWLIEKEAIKGLDSSMELRLVLLEKLGEVLKRRTDHALLKLYLEAFAHLCSKPSSQSLPFPHKSLVAVHTECRRILLSMAENDHLSPELRSHALCVVALLLTQRRLSFVETMVHGNRTVERPPVF